MAEPSPPRSLPSTLVRAPIELRLVGRTVLHALAVGASAGAAGVVLVYALEHVQQLLLEDLCGYVPLRAAGDRLMGDAPTPFRPWLLWIVPALGALFAGLISAKLAPETAGGGGDAMIDAFHHRGGVIRRRVGPIKALASVLTLGAGGSGGREGPTMQIGAAIGSLVGRYVRVDARERRILLVAGCAAGMAAVFRTPLGAALLAVEILYRDDFESDALIPALLASVVSYSVFVSAYGESTLFAHAPRYPFVPYHLPLYGALAILISVVAVAFVTMLHGVQHRAALLKLPIWVKPAIGGLVVGITAAIFITLFAPGVGRSGQGFGILGGGYGAAQIAITGVDWLPAGWQAVALLVALGSVKMVVTSMTVGSGGSAGDFGPSLVIGALFGGAFGRAMQLLLHDPRIDPGAFALVGMGTFYGGLAHVPVSSLVLVCELAGSYDLLVPLMLAEAIAFVALRNHSLYHAQVPTKRDSPAHGDEMVADVLDKKRVGDYVVRDRAYVTFRPDSSASEILSAIAENAWQDVFPVVTDAGEMVGVVDAEILRTLAAEGALAGIAIATDVMKPPVSLTVDQNLHEALEVMLMHGVREIPVVDSKEQIVGFLDEAEVTRVYLDVTNGPTS